MRPNWALGLVTLLVIGYVYAGVQQASNVKDVNNFLDKNRNSVAALFFYDSSLDEGTESGFWSGVATSVSNIFNQEDGGVPPEHQNTDIEKRISEEADLMQIDVSKEELRELQNQFSITAIPYVVIYDKGVIVLSEVLDENTHEKAVQILENNRPGFTVVPRRVKLAPQEPIITDESRPLLVLGPTPSPVQYAQPATAQSQETAQGPRQVTLAPGETRTQVVEHPASIQQRISGSRTQPTVTLEARPLSPEFQKEKCHVSPPPSHPASSSSGYISELEDYEIPESWLASGYSPLSGNNAEEIDYSRRIQLFDPENITHETSDVRDVYTIPQPITPEPFFFEEIPAPVQLAPKELSPQRLSYYQRINPAPEIVEPPRHSVVQCKISPPEARVAKPEVRIAQPHVNVPQPQVRIPKPEIRTPKIGIKASKPQVRVAQPEVKAAPVVKTDSPRKTCPSGAQAHRVNNIRTKSQ
ncbi:unnamed protein product [Moneuplotes crassus]|uniref:Uncharacterized protein n=1 Tax=Euplotes crassus TaxID=5936 RepID=A0AAD1X9C4_EUPCR|nr:unnamed protein product [Moneuplotes crassus]